LDERISFNPSATGSLSEKVIISPSDSSWPDGDSLGSPHTVSLSGIDCEPPELSTEPPIP